MFEHEGSGEYVFMAYRWNLALDNAQTALDALREIYPSHSWLTTETGGRYVDSAMAKIKDGVVDLHRAGPHILGHEQYEDFKQELAGRHIDEHDDRPENWTQNQFRDNPDGQPHPGYP